MLQKSYEFPEDQGENDMYDEEYDEEYTDEWDEVSHTDAEPT